MSVFVGAVKRPIEDNHCDTCEWMKMNSDPELHCYMFKTEFKSSVRCHQHDDFKDSTSVLVKLLRTAPRGQP